jgi:hypothetical protein
MGVPYAAETLREAVSLLKVGLYKPLIIYVG